MSYDTLLTRNLLAPPSPWDPPSIVFTALTQPTKLLIRLLDWAFTYLHRAPSTHNPHPIRIVCISDTHTLKTSHIPDGDLLIHAGDLANAGTPSELQAQINWLASLPHTHKVVIAGNHDTWLDPRSRKTLSRTDQKSTIHWAGGIRYLQHSAVTLPFHNGARTLNVYGAPQVPTCGGKQNAFQYPRGTDAWKDTIPPETDILVTHTPPKYHLDLPAALGCEHLLKEVWEVQPLLHVFGHIHAGKTDFLGRLKGGRELVYWDKRQRRVERAMTRADGLIYGLLDPRSWLDVISVLYHGLGAIMWERVWGGSSGFNPTVMVLASLMYNNTGKLGHEAQVVLV